MPPFVPRKRRSPSPVAPPAKRQATARKNAATRAKPTLFDALDSPAAGSTPEQTRAYLQNLDSSEDSLSEADSDDFEDVPVTKKRKVAGTEDDGSDAQRSDGGDDEEMDWEDAIQSDQPQGAPAQDIAEEEIGDLSISLNDDGSVAAAQAAAAAATNGKKGPSKRERTIRIRTHCLHVQSLMWHNAVRNSWLNDKELHKILIDGLSDGMKREIDRWREDMGMEERLVPESTKAKGKSKGKGKNTPKGQGKSKDKRDGRDWGVDAGRLEKGAVNMSRGDPLLRLLKIITAYWRKRFVVTAPGLRKQGYMHLRRLRDEINSWKKNRQNPQEHGERLESVKDLRGLARKCKGSRDVGSQLFTALLRALGLEARMVANLQPAGIGWNKNEDARPKKGAKSQDPLDLTKEEPDDDDEPAQKNKLKQGLKSTRSPPSQKASTKRGKDKETAIINLEDDESDLSSVPSDLNDDDSVIDVTPSVPSKSTKKYDRDLPFPIYWTEVLSPVSNVYIPIDAIVLSTVASNQELLSTFEPRGKRADQAKQVMCYTIAHSPDGSAKDVTVRYLKRHQLPGRTKGYRMPVEKIKVLNKRGKVKKYEDYDWFKTVMSSYERPSRKRTAADDLEESTDLKPYKPAAEKPKFEAESLQWYKQSAEFVLERHLRREEALLPGSEPVKTFIFGKGDKAAEEPVYLRSDVVACKTAESWHKEGRQIKVGEQPLKMVPVRAVTTIRKREMEEAERETGEKLKQGLFSFDQCEWIIPPPIKDGVIPRNSFGNMDVYTPSMVPKGAVHIPLRGTAKICRKMDIDYAEACTGFEFGNRRAVPILTGVVVARGNEDAIIDAWEIEQEEKRRKEDVKREQACLHLWRKFLMGMRIVERMRTEYTESNNAGTETNPFVKKQKEKQNAKVAQRGHTSPPPNDANSQSDSGSVAGGGFFLPGEEEEEESEDNKRILSRNRNVVLQMDEPGGFIREDEDGGTSIVQAEASLKKSPHTPVSLQSAAHAKYKQDDEFSEDEGLSPERKQPPKGRQARSAKESSKPTVRQKSSKTQPRKKKVVQPSLSSDDEDVIMNDSSRLSNTSPTPDPPSPPPPKQQSPQVIVTPSRAKSAPSLRQSTGKRRTALKSHYFEQQSNTDTGDGTDDDDNGSDSVEEVVRPRKTTARTRAKQT